MTFRDKSGFGWCCLLSGLFLMIQAGPSTALESDRLKPLEVNADSTDGTLGDGTTVLKGKVDVRQGSLLVQADSAELDKVEGRVRRVTLFGSPVLLQQEIEDQGLVSARARRIEYEVATGIITLTGDADVNHPQYKVKGETLIYDMKLQHFQGNGGDGNARIQIELAPEVVPEINLQNSQPPIVTPDQSGEPVSDNPEEASLKEFPDEESNN